MGFELNSVHVTAHTTPQDRVVYALSGGVVIDFPLPTTAEITGSLRIGPNGVLMPDWRRKQLEFTVPIPDLPDDSLLRIIHWAPFVTLAGIVHKTKLSGFALDGFQAKAIEQNGQDEFGVVVDLAVHDLEAAIFRLGYHIDLVGEFVPR